LDKISKEQEVEAKSIQRLLYPTKKFLHCKGYNAQSEKTIYRMEENIFICTM
jgi:hypothetical protein